MLVIIAKESPAAELARLTASLEAKGLRVTAAAAENAALLCLTGETWRIDSEGLKALPYVVDVQRLTPPYPLAARSAKEQGTVVRVGGAAFGRGFCLVAGPCAVESAEQMAAIAPAVARSGAAVLRGGAFKPRTSPYTFQGLGAEGLRLLAEAGRKAGLPVVSEVTDVRDLPLFEDVDMVQIGARNMQNFALLREAAAFGKPVLLKRGMGATVDELLQSAEYLLRYGNGNVVLCERGIRTFAGEMRATLDVGAIPALKQATHLPVIVDPSHAAGRSDYVTPLALAAVAAGADGLMVEVHNDPASALSDGAQALDLAGFAALAEKVQKLLSALR
ncbi:MAG: 3-deoxy-7-phosphoheptulonate synthase [Oscillospiraceae bacterium]|nr:3-deoxy-7-phosphoheptulonate synthase [Oscillospiraceae bacterium]